MKKILFLLATSLSLIAADADEQHQQGYVRPLRLDELITLKIQRCGLQNYAPIAQDVARTDKLTQSVQFSSDGNMLLSILTRFYRDYSCLSYLHVRDIYGQSSSELPIDSTHDEVLSADGETIACRKFGVKNYIYVATLKLNEAVKSQSHRTLYSPDDFSDIKISPHGRIIATKRGLSMIHNSAIQLWSVQEQACRGELKDSSDMRPVQFSSDESKLLAQASALATKKIQLWDLETQTCTTTIHGAKYMRRAVLSPDGKMIFTRAFDGTLDIWDATQQKHIATFERPNGFFTISPDGSTLASAAGDTIRLWSIPEQKCIATLPEQDNVLSVTFSPTRQQLASRLNNNIIKVWNL